jgi:hypothetical protein
MAMTILIDNSFDFLIIFFASLFVLLPQIHLLLIFSIKEIEEWFYKLFQKISKLFIDIYDIIAHIFLDPVILYFLFIYAFIYALRFITFRK